MADQPSGDVAPLSFEAALEALTGVVAQLESGGLGLSESIAAYERGIALLRRLHEELAAVEARVNVLVRIDEEGRPVFAAGESADGAFEARSSDSTQSAPPRPSRAASRGRARRLPGMDDVAEAP